MVTTESYLQNTEGGELAFALVLDGYNLIYTTTTDTAGIATAYASTDWTTVKSGLELIGTVEQEIEPFDPKNNASGMTFKVLDADGTLAALILGFPASTVDVAQLQETLEPNRSTVLAKPGTTSGFASSGTVYIGHEAITHTTLSSGLDED